MCTTIESRGQIARRGGLIGRHGRGPAGSGSGMADMVLDHVDLGMPAGSAA